MISKCNDNDGNRIAISNLPTSPPFISPGGSLAEPSQSTRLIFVLKEFLFCLKVSCRDFCLDFFCMKGNHFKYVDTGVF